jgi:hypothetical protein
MLGTNTSSMFGWSAVLRQQDLLPEARALCVEGLRLAYDSGVTRDVALGFRTLGSVLVDQGEAERGITLCGAADAILTPLGLHLGNVDDRRLVATIARATARLGQEGVTNARGAGRGLTLEQALQLALLHSGGAALHSPACQ